MFGGRIGRATCAATQTAGGSGVTIGTGHHPFRYAGMRKTFRPPVKLRRERRWLVRREREDEAGEQDAILDLGCAEKQAATGGASG